MSEKRVLAEDMAPDFTFNTPLEQGLKLSEVVKRASKTYLVFLRFYGCRISQMYMRDYTQAYARFQEKDAQLLVVLQSSPQSVREQIDPSTVPYTIVCDLNEKLYKLYQVKAAATREELFSEKAVAMVAKAEELGLAKGTSEGNPLQLPAVFLIDSNGKIVYAHRAVDAGDLPSTEEMLAKL